MDAEKFALRRAVRGDQPAIRALIHAVHINPMGVDWRRFVVAVDEGGQLVGGGQIKVHGDGARELASIAVVEGWRGRGVARAVIEELMANADPPLWLTCRSRLAPLYQKFGFRRIGPSERLPRYFSLVRSMVSVLTSMSNADEGLAIMVWRGD